MNLITEQQKAELDLLAMQRVDAMNSDEYLCLLIDEKVKSMEEHIKLYFEQRFSFHKEQKQK